MDFDIDIIHPDAKPRYQAKGKNGWPTSAFYYLQRRKVGFRGWSAEGILQLEYAIANNQMHGPCRHFDEQGHLITETAYFEGLEHAVARQYGENGKLIGMYWMHYGSGVDLWYTDQGEVAEERHYKNGCLHGYERWWGPGGESVCEEGHYQHSKPHGIFRQWGPRGKLEQGYPHFFINGEEVAKRIYIKATETDLSLPKYEKLDNKPQRQRLP